jgi:dTDP-glucose pyrophosphorylase
MIIIPMAGKSSRFSKAGYNEPKYKLPLGESNVFDEAVKSFKKYFQSDLFLFIAREDNGVLNFIKSRIEKLKIKNYEIIQIDFDTRGQADTVFEGLIRSKKNLEREELYIFNIDSIRIDFEKPPNSFLVKAAGFLEVFIGEGDHWSFVDPKNDEIVRKTTEKLRVSNLCSNGLYYFQSVKSFQESFKAMLNNNSYNELYVAPMYNFLIEKGKLVKYTVVDKNQILFSGIPSEYEKLKKSYV